MLIKENDYEKIVYLGLVFALITCLIIPVMAVSGNGVYKGQYPYQWTVTRTSTQGIATMKTTSQPTTVGAAVKNFVRYDNKGTVGFSYSTGSAFGDINPINGYAYITATASNRFTGSDGLSYTGVVDQTNGYFYVNGNLVESNVTA